EPLNWLDAVLLAYVAQVAEWCAAPRWAELRAHLGATGLVLAYLGLGLAVLVCRRWPRAVLAAAAVGVACWLPLPSFGGGGAEPPRGLRVTVLDVGQGDAILLQPAHAAPVLVDGGPPGDGLERKLEDAGVEALGAVVVTHDQSDHAGGVEELLGELPVGRFLFDRVHPGLIAAAKAAGAAPERIAAGRELRSGGLRLRVLWPPAELLGAASAGEDPNRLALVMEARWHRFAMLLTADAEAEAVPLEPGPVDVLKVAHHGSDDAGLAGLLERTRPRLAVISVGAGNPYGHPTAATIATLARHGVATFRTDEEGSVVIEVSRRSIRVDR
ncbi:MAG TPA: MBL fold metallo-hydrolase, partial [Sphingomicrobium sp.]|nr:MBL fold metallo-hydrolase [Sphingomicrobium sp.]